TSDSILENIPGESREKEFLESGQKLSENQRRLERYQQQIQELNRQIESLLQELKNSALVGNKSDSEINESRKTSDSILENIPGESREKEFLESGQKLSENQRRLERYQQQIQQLNRQIENLLQELKNSAVVENKFDSEIPENLKTSDSIPENIPGDSREKELLESAQKSSQNQRILERYQQQIQQLNRQIEGLLQELKNSAVVENKSDSEINENLKTSGSIPENIPGDSREKEFLESGQKLSQNQRRLERYQQQIQQLNRQIENLLQELKNSALVENKSDSEIPENLKTSDSIPENIPGDSREKELLESAQKSSQNQRILERYQQQIQQLNRQIEGLLQELKNSAVVENKSDSEINENLKTSGSIPENIPGDSREKEFLESGQKLSQNQRRLERYQQQIQQLNRQIENLLQELKNSALVENKSDSEIPENLRTSNSNPENITGDSREKELLESGEKLSQNRRILERYQQQIQQLNRQIESLLQELKKYAVVENKSDSEIPENLRTSNSNPENITGDSREKELLESGEKLSQNRRILERYQQQIQQLNRQIESLLQELKKYAVVENKPDKELLKSRQKLSQNRRILERYQQQIQQLNRQIESLLWEINNSSLVENKSNWEILESRKTSDSSAENIIGESREKEFLESGQKLSQTKFLDYVNNFSDSDEIYIRNAGLILLWPFLKGFLLKIGLVQENIFIDIISAERAAILFQYIVDNSTEIPEYVLPLNKILCGIDLLEPIDTNLEITKQEITECEYLLSAVIQNWSILKNTSIEGFRKAFLQRKGILKIRDGSYLLQVERETYDILLDRIPWSIKVVKLPWMDNILYVEW
ncbi:MAG: hypothetical protein MGG11_03075, partial [Trichodesmium sp. MAG_R03]|nr:hypothetical protein [Trichodesmium sp. MAG_R03]